MKVIQINSSIIAFYYGGESAPANSPAGSEDDWVYGACHSLGVAAYAVYSGNSCVVFDTLCSPEQAGGIKTHLQTELGISKFTVVNSHWHLHHIGGNALYEDCNIIGTRKTRAELIEQKALIEAGTSSWGPPPIETVRPPDIVFDSELSVFLGDLELRLLAVNIHSADSLCAFLPASGALLAGDMVEDTVPFITDPAAIPEHVKNYDRLRELDIKTILPNHCRLRALENGGYPREIIGCSAYYLDSLHKLLAADPAAAVPDVKSLMAEYFDSGLISYWPPYERVHKNNVRKLRAYFKNC